MTDVAGLCHRFTIGRFECFALSDGVSANRRPRFAGRVIAGMASGARVTRRVPATAYPTSRTSLLVRAPGLCALIDTGAGATARDPGRLLAHLALAGVSAAEVDTVILTHAHLGHLGGALDPDGRPAFQHARYVLAADEWEFWMARPDLRARRLQRMADRIQAHLAALRERVTLVTGGEDVVSGIQAVPAYGHTAGHLAISITSAGEELLCLGDTALTPGHLAHPEWYSRYDLRPEQSVTSRVRLLDRAAAAGALVHACHFPFPGLGWARPEGQAWRWESVIPQQGPPANQTSSSAP